ncbi:MAG: TonB-dependent receptor [Erythrobacter sp.]
MFGPKSIRGSRLGRHALLGSTAIAVMAVSVGEAKAQNNEIVVTARKVEENVQDVPIAITAFTEETFEEAGLTEFADVAQLTPNFDIRPNAIAGSQFAVSTIRGQTNAFFTLNIEQAIAVSIDGAPITRGTSLFSNLFDVERVEVLKGPQGTLFGKNSTGGAVNVVTRAPVIGEFEGYGQFTVGNFGRTDAEAVVNIPLGDTIAARFGAQITHRDGFGQTDPSLAGANFELADDNELSLRGSVLFEPTDTFSLRINANYKEVDEAPVIQRGLENVFLPIEVAPGVFIQFPLALASISQDPFEGDFFAGTAGGRPLRRPFARSDEFNINATATLDIGAATLTSVTSYREQNSLSELQNAISTSIFLGQESQIFAQELRLNGQAFEDRLNWQVGAFFSDESGFDNDTLPEAGQFQLNRSENRTFSLFTQNSFDVTDNITLTGGLRWTSDNRQFFDNGPGSLDAAGLPIFQLGTTGPLFEGDETFDAFSWLISLDFKPVDDVLFYWSVSRGFRSGGFDQDGLGTIFEPEFVTNYETGWKADLLDNRLRFNGSVFLSDYTDIQILAGVPLAGNTGAVQTVLDNAGEATIWGFELELAAEPVDGLTFGGTLAHTNGEFDEFLEAAPGGGFIDRSDEPIGGQEWTFTINGRYEFDIAEGVQLGASGNFFWVNDLELDTEAVITNLASGGTLESYGILNAQIDVNFEDIGEGLNVALFANNLTDELFFPAGFVIPFGALGVIDNRITGDPRTYGVRVTQKF